MKKILLSILSITSLVSYAQHASCDGARYITSQYTVNTTMDIVFGNSTTISGNNADLKLDFYEPAGDVAVNRPLIILAFGGSFIGGSRDAMDSYCEYYASKGYAAATIDYRLYDGSFFPLPDSIVMTDEVIKAVSDMKASIRFFREDAATTNQYKIDTNLIFVGGISAGSIVGLHTGMLQETDVIQPFIDSILNENGGWTGNSSTNLQYGAEVAGILNYSGALKWASYIDANDPPVFSVHDDADNTVPYNTDYAQVFGQDIILMQGSGVIHGNAQSAGVQSELITIPNSAGHVSYFNNSLSTDSVLLRSLEFLYPLVCNQPAPMSIAEVDEIEMNVYPNPANNQITIELSSNDVQIINILDLTGRVVMTQNSSGELTTIDVDSFAPGNYLIEIKSVQGDDLLSRKKLIKL
jgi:hypothetical protein